MDEYKLVNVTKLVAALTYTANKIRSKLGISSKLDFDLEGETGFGDDVDDIQVGITPSGSIELTANGTYDVTEKASAVVAVPQPTGSIEITANGTYDVTEKASAIVNVQSGGGITPSGTKEITITENGTTIEDVTNYANAQITVNVSSGGGGSGGIDRGSFTPAEKTNTVELQVSKEITGLMILAETNPYTGTGHRTAAGLLYDNYGGVRANGMMGSNAAGSAGSVSMSANAFTVTQNGNVVTVVSATGAANGYFAAGITYRWVAW